MFLAFLLLSSAWSYAQYPSEGEEERFTVNQVRGCAPLAVEVISENIPPGNTSPTIYDFNYGGNINDPINPDRDQDYQDTVYAIPGTYKILQILGSEFDSITIEVLEPRPPQVQVFPCINNGVFLEINDDYYDRLRIDYGDGVTVEVLRGSPSTSYRYATPGSYDISVQGIFDNADSDNCAVTDTTITTINTLTVADLNAVTVESATSVRLNYELPNPNVPYRLEVSEAGSTEFDIARYYVGNQEEFVIDDPVLQTDEQSYCFRVVAVNRCDEDQNLPSDVLCSIALRAEAQDRQNQLTWTSEGFADYTVLRDANPITTTSATEYTDTDVVCQQEYQYQVTAESPDGTSASEQIALTAASEATAEAPDSVAVAVAGRQLQVGWPPVPEATQYYVYRGEEEQVPSLYDSVGTADSTFLAGYEDAAVTVGTAYCYQLSYVDECGNESALSEPEVRDHSRAGRGILSERLHAQRRRTQRCIYLPSATGRTHRTANLQPLGRIGLPNQRTGRRLGRPLPGQPRAVGYLYLQSRCRRPTRKPVRTGRTGGSVESIVYRP